MMPRIFRPGLALGLCLALFSGCYSASAYKRAENLAKGLDRVIQERKEYNRNLDLENKRLMAENATYRKNAKKAGEVEELRKELEGLIAKWKEGPGIAGASVITSNAGDTGVRIEGSILFASGSSAISEAGKKLLLDLIPLLSKSPEIRIDGHSDDTPIKNSTWKSNLHLSVARALAVSDVLVAGKMHRERITVQGMGPTHPISTESPEKNRRVEIFMIQTKATQK